MKISKVRSLIALFAAFLMVSGSGLAISAASATEGTKPVPAKVSSFYNHECNSSQWQFVATQVKDEASAPATISVTWANHVTETIALSSFTGGTAHYITTSNLESSVVSATMNIYLEWGGEFNLSDGPCDATPPPETTPEGSNNSSSPSCEKIMVGTPTGVQPDGATVVVKLDGVPTLPGTYPTTPGTHIVTTFVDGTEVDSDSVPVDKCAGDQPADKVTYTEWKDGDKSCENKTVTQTRTKTVTPYKWDGSDWVLDTANATSTTETGSRPMTADELKACEGTPPPPDDTCQGLTGSIKTTLPDGSVVNGNIYDNKSDVYVYGDKLGDVTTVYIRVTDPSGSTVLSDVKQVSVTDGSFGPVQLPAFSDTPNNGGEYKVAVATSSDFENNACTKFDNFKVKGDQPPPPTKPEGAVVVASNDCETITFSSKDVKPEDAAVIYMLDGVVKPAGTYDVTPGQHTVELYVNGDKVDSKTVTVEECKLPPPPPPGEEAENTYAASANGCDDLLTGEGDASVTATFTNTDDDTDKAVVVGARLVDMFGQTYGTQPAVSVPDGSSQDYVFTGLSGGDYSVEFVDGDGNVIKTVDVFVEYCELPPLEEGDATAHGICHAAVVNSNEDAAGTVLYGDFDELNPDGQTTVAANGTVKLPTRRLELDIVVFFDNGRYSRFDNIKVKQNCGHHGHHVPPPPHNPPHPHNPGNGTPPPSWTPPTTPVVSVTPTTPVAPTAVTAFSETGVAAPEMVRSFSPFVGVGVFGLGLFLMLVAARGNLTFRRRKFMHI